MSEKKSSFWRSADDLIDNIGEYFDQEASGTIAGRDITQDNSRTTTTTRTFQNDGDVVEGDQSNTIISTSECNPESISIQTVERPFWADDIKTIDIKCKEISVDKSSDSSSAQSVHEDESDLQAITSVENNLKDPDVRDVASAGEGAQMPSEPDPGPDLACEASIDPDFEFEFEF